MRLQIINVSLYRLLDTHIIKHKQIYKSLCTCVCVCVCVCKYNTNDFTLEIRNSVVMN